MKFDLDKVKNAAVGLFIIFTAAANIYSYVAGGTLEDIEIIPAGAEIQSEYDSKRSIPIYAASDDEIPAEIGPVSEEAMAAPEISETSYDSDMIDINTAGGERLQELDGIGPSKADAIIKYRENYGGFVCIEEIMEVKGIGEATFNKIKDKIYVTK